MWRKLLISIGEFLERVLTLQTLLMVYGLAGGINIIINIIVGSYSPQTPFQNAQDIFFTFVWLLLFFVITYLLVQGFCKLLIWAGNYYPNWYYFPKIDMRADTTPENNIVVTISNLKKRQTMSLRAIYARMDYKVKRPMVLVSGVAPDSVKELLPLSPMNGICSRTVKIGRIEDGCLILFGGVAESADVMRFTEPMVYTYMIKFQGEFRNKQYIGSADILIRITEDKEVKIEEEANKNRAKKKDDISKWK